MKRIFNQVRMTRPGKNAFDLGHERKLSCHMAQLVPILVEEVVPGDKFKVNAEIFARMAPMIAPMMHRVNIFTHYFFVPNRLTWDNWEKFVTGGEQGDYIPPAFPLINIKESMIEWFRKGSLSDHMGIPSVVGATIEADGFASSLPFRAYQMIYNEYYRDQNLEDALVFSTGDVVSDEDHAVLLAIRTRCWEKDYFTSALPWAQRGGDVQLPIQSEVNYSNTATMHVSNTGQAPNIIAGTFKNDVDNEGKLLLDSANPDLEMGIHNIDSISNTAATINDLRRSIRLQEWLEKNARAGSRYIEQIFSHFGVRSSDARLQRPEYLGGSKQPLVISEVLSTQSDETGDPLGTMGGHGVSVARNFAFNKFFEEHGYIIGIMSIIPRTAYQQGIPRMYSKFDKFDYFFPEFAHIGEQEVLNQELYWDYTGVTPMNGDTFGYQSRYAEYKFKESSVHGDFKDNLNYWHMGRIFETPPALNAAFVHANPTHRIWAVTDPTIHKMWIQIYNDVKAIRPMPIFGTPRL